MRNGLRSYRTALGLSLSGIAGFKICLFELGIGRLTVGERPSISQAPQNEAERASRQWSGNSCQTGTTITKYQSQCLVQPPTQHTSHSPKREPSVAGVGRRRNFVSRRMNVDRVEGQHIHGSHEWRRQVASKRF